MSLKDAFGWLSSGPKAAEKVLDAGIRGIDALVYTDEEKAVAHQKLMDTWLKLQEQLAGESTVRAVTRRILAFIFAGSFVTLNLAAAVVYFWNDAYAQFLFNVADGQFGIATTLVVGFYFGPHMLQRLVTSWRTDKKE